MNVPVLAISPVGLARSGSSTIGAVIDAFLLGGDSVAVARSQPPGPRRRIGAE
jgi:hypothetical protein